MNGKRLEKSENNDFKKFILLKVILIIIFLIQIYIFSSLRAKKKSERKIIKNESSINIQNETKIQNIVENKKSKEMNLSEYNMTNIIVYDDSYFNSLSIFYFFKKKFFNITYFNYFYSEKFQKVKLVFDFGIFDQNKTLIEPSDFTLFHKFIPLCFMKVKKPKNIIYSLPKIVENKYYECIEYFQLNETVKFGIHFYHHNRMESYLSLTFHFSDLINLEEPSHINDDIFDNEFVETKYEILLKKTKDPKNSDKYKLLKYYMKLPISDLKRYAYEDSTGWIFKNIYNNYFCYCLGKKCVKEEINQKCKFNFYKYIIDSNRYLYPKTHYIFVDFIFEKLPSDDTFPVFDEMIKRNMSVHYITEKKELHEEFCNDEKKCQTIIPISRATYYKYGDFLEKYLTLMLKLKAVISCKESSYHYLSYLFYKIEYVTYIAVGHGVDFFKDYLFNNYRIYGSKINNKILIPPSPKLVDIPIEHGWSEENIIKINLPRWDRYSNVDYYFPGNITNNSILVMFTWRFTRWWYGYKDLSDKYHENIINILENKKLNKVLNKKNMTLYFSLHRFVNRKYLKKYDEIIENNIHIEYVKQNQLSECLAKTNLVLSDFSSIIFDLMSRGKPFVIYVPDAEDEKIENIYTKDYVRLINDMKNDKIKFKNKCETLEETVDKIIKYINNDFKLESDLEKFYKSFNFKIQNNSNEFIDYLINLE